MSFASECLDRAQIVACVSASCGCMQVCKRCRKLCPSMNIVHVFRYVQILVFVRLCLSRMFQVISTHWPAKSGRQWQILAQVRQYLDRVRPSLVNFGRILPHCAEHDQCVSDFGRHWHGLGQLGPIIARWVKRACSMNGHELLGDGGYTLIYVFSMYNDDRWGRLLPLCVAIERPHVYNKLPLPNATDVLWNIGIRRLVSTSRVVPGVHFTEHSASPRSVP